MNIIKKVLSPLYVTYRHITDTNNSKSLFDIQELMNAIPVSLYDVPRIKIRVSHFSESSWNSIMTMMEAFLDDKRCDVLVILARDDDRMRRQAISIGAPYIVYDNYDVEKDKPDVLIISHTMDNMFNIQQRRFIKKVFVASAALIHYLDSIDKYIDVTQSKYGQLSPDYYIYDKLMYDELKLTNRFADNLVCLGNPKYDGIFNATNNKENGAAWRKLSGKKVVLWAPDHGVQYGRIAEDFSFEVYARLIFDFFAAHKEMGLIFRPHPTFIEEMIKHKYWTEHKIDDFKNLIVQSENIVWDENDTYDNAYASCDAIVTDCHCGIICSALPTLKPMGLLYKSHDVKTVSEKIESCQYAIYNTEELKAFLENIGKGRDEKLQLRKDVTKEAVCSFDGQNGTRIKEFILENV